MTPRKHPVEPAIILTNGSGIWQVRRTTCYPYCWKVFPTRKYVERNDTSEYFPTREAALLEAIRRNKKEIK